MFFNKKYYWRALNIITCTFISTLDENSIWSKSWSWRYTGLSWSIFSALLLPLNIISAWVSLSRYVLGVVSYKFGSGFYPLQNVQWYSVENSTGLRNRSWSILLDPKNASMLFHPFVVHWPSISTGKILAFFQGSPQIPPPLWRWYLGKCWA